MEEESDHSTAGRLTDEGEVCSAALGKRMEITNTITISLMKSFQSVNKQVKKTYLDVSKGTVLFVFVHSTKDCEVIHA